MTVASKRAPVYIVPESIDEFDEDKLVEFLKEIRERRQQYVKLYQEQQRLKKEAQTQKVRDKVEKQFGMLRKEIDRYDKLIVALDKRITNIRALCVELDMEIIE